MVANIIQTLFIMYAYQLNAQHSLGLGYLYQIPTQFVGTSDQGANTFSTLFLSKFTIFNFIYFIYSPSKAFNVAINDHSMSEYKQFSKKVSRARTLHAYNYMLNMIILIIGMIIAAVFEQIVTSLFTNLQ